MDVRIAKKHVCCVIIIFVLLCILYLQLVFFLTALKTCRDAETDSEQDYNTNDIFLCSDFLYSVLTRQSDINKKQKSNYNELSNVSVVVTSRSLSWELLFVG